MTGYPVGLAGESNYQTAIARARVGDCVEVLHETGNPYDELALVVKTMDGSKLGYIAKDCWLREAIHAEGKGCAVAIMSIEPGSHGAGVVIQVLIDDGEIAACEYQP